MLSGHEKRRAFACGQANKEEMKDNLVVPVSVFEKKLEPKQMSHERAIVFYSTSCVYPCSLTNIFHEYMSTSGQLEVGTQVEKTHGFASAILDQRVFLRLSH
jgi:hypothetical protein